MRSYGFTCKGCKKKFTYQCLRVADYEKFLKKPKCPKCGGKKVDRDYTGMQLQSFLRGDGWAGKTLKEKRYREKRNADLDVRMRERWKSTKLLPNVGGEVVKDWDDAAKLAKSRKKSTAEFDRLAQKEKRDKNRPSGVPRKFF